MIYILSIILILGIIILFYLVYDMGILNNIKKNKTAIVEVEAKDIEQNILIEIAKYEKFLYKKGFVRRIILKVVTPKTKIKNYKFYYYNILDGMHSFLEIYEIGETLAINYFFMTIYQSQKYTISTKFTKEPEHKEKNGLYIHKHNNLTIQELYIMHTIDRKKENETILKEKLTLQKVLNLPIFIKNLNIKNIREIKKEKKESKNSLLKNLFFSNPFNKIASTNFN